MRKKTKQFDLAENIRGFFKLTPYMGIIDWAEKFINFSDDVSAQRDKLDLDFYPYQRDLLRAFEDLTHIKEVVICAPEQCRKINDRDHSNALVDGVLSSDSNL